MMRTAVVTGATGGIGTAVVRTLADRGYRVFAVGRSAAGFGIPVALDLAGPVELPPRLAELDRVDVLVHCAGIAEVMSVADSTPALWQRTMAVNVLGPAELTRRLLPALRAAGGHVVVVNIAAGTQGVPNWSAYVASKAALRELTDSLRAEEARHGLRVTTIYPSGVDTELLRTVREQFGMPYDPDACVRPETLAWLVLTAIDCPPDAQLTELTIKPATVRQ